MFLRDYALTGEREYFAEYFACYLRAGNDMERAAEMERPHAADLWLVRCAGEERMGL